MLPVASELQARTTFTGFHSWEDNGDSDAGAETYCIRGFSQVIPRLQGQIPGWTRICFVRYLRYDMYDFGDVADTSFFEEEMANHWPPTSLWDDFEMIEGCEGIILPGGKIMIGQYFNMLLEGESDCERGPFIYWQ